MTGRAITQIDIYVVKMDRHYKVGGHTEMPNRLPGTDYYVEPQWTQAYSGKTESCLVRIRTSDGTEGWGEAQAPVVPEVAASLVTNLLGPALIGHNAMATECAYDRLHHLMAARGQQFGFYLDAMAAIDIALWDIRGKFCREPVCSLLGGPFRTRLPAYVSGLRKPDRESRCAVARESVSRGFRGVKIFSGARSQEVESELEAVRQAVGQGAFFAFDAIHAYDLREALLIGGMLDRRSADWMEAPVGVDDLTGHARLATSIVTPVAGGETLRSPAQFLPWLQSGALRIAQPDVTRCGITAAKRIADLAQAFHAPAAVHLGVCTGIGVAATWHVAAALPRFAIQEHQLDLFDVANRVLVDPLREENGELLVPLGPGLGITVEESAVSDMASGHWVVGAN